MGKPTTTRNNFCEFPGCNKIFQQSAMIGTMTNNFPTQTLHNFIVNNNQQASIPLTRAHSLDTFTNNSRAHSLDSFTSNSPALNNSPIIFRSSSVDSLNFEVNNFNMHSPVLPPVSPLLNLNFEVNDNTSAGVNNAKLIFITFEFKI
eukprot:Pgem_evm2s17659